MFSWLSKDESRIKQPEVYDRLNNSLNFFYTVKLNQNQLLLEYSVVEGLKKIYKSKILPLESNYFFHDFHSPELSDPDFDARPMILLVGQVTSQQFFLKILFY
jgi:hypothetical protein